MDQNNPRLNGIKWHERDKAYAITITINQHRDKLAPWQRIHVPQEIVDDEAALGSILAIAAKKMIKDVDGNGDEIRKTRL